MRTLLCLTLLVLSVTGRTASKDWDETGDFDDFDDADDWSGDLDEAYKGGDFDDFDDFDDADDWTIDSDEAYKGGDFDDIDDWAGDLDDLDDIDDWSVDLDESDEATVQPTPQTVQPQEELRVYGSKPTPTKWWSWVLSF